MGGNTSKEEFLLSDKWEELKFLDKYTVSFYPDCLEKSSGRKVTVFKCLKCKSFDQPETNFLKYFQLYRHPNLVSYLASWEEGGYTFIVTSHVRRLNPEIDLLYHEGIAVGLHSVVEGISFLYEKVGKIPMQFDLNSLYVSNEDNSWKLLAFPLCILVCNKSMEKSILHSLAEFIENFPTNLHGAQKLIEYLKGAEKFNCNTILSQEFFATDFIKIWCFLKNLPVYSSEDKEEFFRNIGHTLKKYPESLIGKFMMSMLLQRICLLDIHAQKYLYNMLLIPRTDMFQETSLLSIENFKKYAVPHLLNIFRVRDAGVRLALLTHFEHYVAAIPLNDLESIVLPELLMGVRDTSDTLVIRSLKCLAALVPIVGSLAVVGSNRQKLFGDGRPKEAPSMGNDSTVMVSKIQPSTDIEEQVNSDIPLRSSPDGREIDPHWPSWSDNFDDDDGNVVTSENPLENRMSGTHEIKIETCDLHMEDQLNGNEINNIGSEYEITVPQKAIEVDFFADMEPKLDLKKQTLEDLLTQANSDPVATKFDMLSTNDSNQDSGWDDIEW